jgi:hypothetical protein
MGLRVALLLLVAGILSGCALGVSHPREPAWPTVVTATIGMHHWPVTARGLALVLPGLGAAR